MNQEDMILISVDDHIVEPPDMFVNHLPKKYRAEAPRLVHNPDGIGYVEVPRHGHPERRAQRRRRAAPRRSTGWSRRVSMRSGPGVTTWTNGSRT